MNFGSWKIACHREKFKKKKIRIGTNQFNLPNRNGCDAGAVSSGHAVSMESDVIEELDAAFCGLGIMEEYRIRKVKERRARESQCGKEWTKLLIDQKEMFLRRFSVHSNLDSSTSCIDCAQEINPENASNICGRMHLRTKSAKVL